MLIFLFMKVNIVHNIFLILLCMMTSSANLFFTQSDLLAQLAMATGPDGTVGQIGKIVVDWVNIYSLYSLFIIMKDTLAGEHR